MSSLDRRRFDCAWLALLMTVSSIWCISAASRLGPTFDEPLYLARGLEAWRTGSKAGLLRVGTMPLPANFDTLPLYLAERWHGQPWDVTSDMSMILPWARASALPFWWLLLFYAWRIAYSLGGPWAGRLAAAVLACEPNLLAHASLATTDIPLTATLLAFTFHYKFGREADSRWRRVVIPGIWFGVALLAKASTMVFGPICMAVIEAERYIGSPSRPPAMTIIRQFIRNALAIGAIGYSLAFLYCGCDWQPEASFVAWARSLPDGTGKSIMLPIAENLRIFSNAGEAFVRQIKHNSKGHGTYLLGQQYDRAVWFYFPVLMTIKLTIPFLIAPLIVLAVRPRCLRNWAFLVGIVLAIFSLSYRVQIGIRFVLPCIAFVGIGCSVAIVEIARSIQSRSGQFVLRWTVGAACGWLIIASMFAWPDGLRYVNEIWGGSNTGYRLASDSNFDWGQGLPELARWQQAHHVDDLNIWYFGTDPTVLTMRQLTFHTMAINSTDEVRRCVAGRRLAVGATVLYGHREVPGHRAAAEFLQTQQPIDRVGTFLIFDFRGLTPTPPDRFRADSR